jgi:tetratricopeptide (TPR) repeat protein/predicted AlkP superfamily phosphohydrolase/phosphomutase
MAERATRARGRLVGTTTRRVLLVLLAAVALWVLGGIRSIDEHEFGVLDGPLLLGSSRLVDGGWTVAPAPLLRLTTYPRYGLELPLPPAESAMLPASDGSRYGFRGWITVRPRLDGWRQLHQAAARDGLRGALLEAVRQAASGLRPGSERGLDGADLTRELRRGLSASLRERGLELRRLELDSIDFLAVEEGSPTPEPSAARLLVIGLDGLDWEILDELIAQDRLPNLARLIEEGASAKLLTISPMLSPVIWTTVATGVEPSRHGILDFLVQDAEAGASQPVTSVQRRAPTVWELLSRAGVDVGVTGWWASWPADPVRGYLVSDRIAYQLFGFRSDPDDARGKTWPPELYERIRPLIVAPDSVAWEDVMPYLGGPRKRPEEFDADERELLDELRTLLASGRSYMAIDQELRREFQPQFEALYLEGTDTIGHLFMSYRPPRLPGVEAKRFESFSGAVDRYYETADRFVGQLLEDRGPEWTVMILSDHGFASDATRPQTTDSRVGHGPAADWHRRFGVLILSGAHVRQGVRLEEASVYDIAPTVLALFAQPVPRSWPGRTLGAALDEAFLERYPVRYRLDDPARAERMAEEMVDPAAADLLAKLQSLGYVSASGANAESVTARNNAGVALMAEGRFDEAEREFLAGLETSPGSPMLTLNLGLALRLQGRVDEAIERFRQAFDYPATMKMSGHLLAQLLMSRGELDEAQSLLQHVLEREPAAADVRNTLGQLLERRGRVQEAASEYERAVELDPNAAMPRNNLGNLARRRGDLDQAERWYLEAIEADPYFMGAYNNLALVYQDRGEMDKARDLYARAVAKAPNNAELLNNLGSWYYAQGEFEEARKYWGQAATADPNYPSPLNNLAGLEINAQRFPEAERLLRRALELDPGYGDARINLSLVLSARGDLDAAREQLRMATVDARTGANAWAKLGAFELEAGYVDQAIEALEQGRKLAPRSTELLNYLGEAYRRKGLVERAVALWRESLAIDPRQARLREYLEREFPATGSE